jgi:large subunit ribosomal protein L15
VKLHELSPPEGATKKRKRVGRGPGSGNGKTSGKGHKGQLSRSGGGKGPGFEGGQMPLVRRVPKRGFTNSLRKKWLTVNLADLARLGLDAVDPQVLRERGLVKGTYDGIKVLGSGELSAAVTIRAHAISEGARRKLEAAGGTFEVVSP